MNRDTLSFYTTADTAVLWWEKPAAAAARQTYEIILDGKTVGTEDKTHTVIHGLIPRTEHTVTVQMPLPEGSLPLGRITFCMPQAKHRIDVTAAPYCASGDGRTMNTAALQKAIDDCGPDSAVYLPAGTYVTGALRLHSDMELYLEKDAVLKGSARPEDYLPRIHSRFEGIEMECYQSLLNLGELDHTAGPNCKNVIIQGEGTICGGGKELALTTIESERERLKDYLAANAALIATCENSDTIPGRVRGRLINLSNCSNVRISGLTLADGASWNVHMIYSDHILTDHCTFKSTGIWNGDGWDPDSSEHCTIFGCLFFTGDDSVAIKSGKNPEGNLINRPTRAIRIFDCRSAFGHGLCMGSEISGGIEDVKIWDCDLENSMVGIEIKGTRKRGGYVRDIQVRDCIVPCLLAHSVGYNDDGVPAPEPPVFERLHYERVTITGRSLDQEWTDCRAIELRGFDADRHRIQDVTFKDVTITGGLGVCQEYCDDQVLSGMEIQDWNNKR